MVNVSHRHPLSTLYLHGRFRPRLHHAVPRTGITSGRGTGGGESQMHEIPVEKHVPVNLLSHPPLRYYTCQMSTRYKFGQSAVNGANEEICEGRGASSNRRLHALTLSLKAVLCDGTRYELCFRRKQRSRTCVHAVEPSVVVRDVIQPT